jgi:hypothetical protein
MSKNRDRIVYRRPDGTWANERNEADRASSLHGTPKEAIDAARRMLQNQGGGGLTTKGVDGKIRIKDTIPPGHDPNPPRDKEHSAEVPRPPPHHHYPDLRQTPAEYL